MENKIKTTFIPKLKEAVGLAKTYWSEPPKGNYVSYKEVAYLSGAGFGVHWTTLLATTIGLNASNFLVGASIGLKPMDLQIMLIVANLIGIPLGIFRAWYYDNHNLKGGKFLPFLRRTAMPTVLVSLVFVWLPYENWDYITKAVVVEIMYLLLNVFLCFYTESYNYFQQIITPDAQERTTVMSISQVVYSLAPTLSNLIIPLVAGLTWGLNDIRTYRIIYPIFTVVGLIISTIFFRKVKERLILPKKKQDPVRIIDAVREVAKNKYYWIIQAAAWVVFLESGYGVVLGWTFVYSNGGQYEATLGLVNTVIGNAALWSMLLAPIVIKKMGKRNLLIASNAINVLVLIVLLFTYENIIFICVLLYFNNFINTFWNITQHGINADMRDYHQWKTGVRIDGLFGPLGLIGTVIGFFTGTFYPAIYEKMGLLDDYNVLYDDTMRNNLFEILIICSIFGAILNLIPFCFYDLTENKHKAYVGVLKIRNMFESFGLGNLEDGELIDAMEIIRDTRAFYENEANANLSKKELKKRKLQSERAEIVMQDLNKFSTKAGQARIERAKEVVALGQLHYYSNAAEELKAAKALPTGTKEEKEIRSDAIRLARIKKEASSLIKRHGSITAPDEKVKEEIQNRETSSFSETMKQRRELKEFAKAQSIYNRATKPYREAAELLEQAENYSHYDVLVERYAALIGENV